MRLIMRDVKKNWRLKNSSVFIGWQKNEYAAEIKIAKLYAFHFTSGADGELTVRCRAR